MNAQTQAQTAHTHMYTHTTRTHAYHTHAHHTHGMVKVTWYSLMYDIFSRSDTPLIYKAVPSWFVTVETIVDQLLENNSKSYW